MTARNSEASTGGGGIATAVRKRSLKAEPGLDWVEAARSVLRSREIDRIEVEELTPANRVALQFSATGHELLQTLVALNLTHPHDAATVYYRSRPFMLASGLSPEEALRASLGRAGSPSEGRDVGVVFNMPRRTGATVLPASGNVGAQYPVAAGWAQSVLYHQRILGAADWTGAIAVAMGGDGSVAANGFWSALNIVTTLRLPMLFVIEDNGYSISVPSWMQTPGGNIAENLGSFRGLEVIETDGADPERCARDVARAVDSVRSGGGPALLRGLVPRLCGHAFNDTEAYRDSDELAAVRARDPLPALLDAAALATSAEQVERLRDEVREEVAAALKSADSAPEPDVAEVTHFIMAAGPAPSATDAEPSGPRINVQEAIRLTLEHELSVNPAMVVFGEDVGAKGGVHGVTRDTQARFGEHRIFDTSLSEDGIVGRAVGMALSGMLPVPEIQFRKYADPAQEQITDAGTLRWRTAGRFRAPMVLRMPVGFGKRCGDPWHAVNGEAPLAHLVGWRVAFPSNAADAVGLLRTALRGDDPTLFLEHRALLDASAARQPYPGDHYRLPFGVAATLTRGDSLTVVTWGEMVYRSLEAAASHPGRVAVLDLRTIVPWDVETVLESVRATGKVLIVHEDTRRAGFGAEIAAVIAEEAFSHLDAPVARIATPDCPTPYNRNLMAATLPGVEGLRRRMAELLAF